MNSLEKVTAFKEALLRTDEEFDGMLGAIQMLVAVEAMKGGDLIGDQIGDDPAWVDEQLLNVAGFVLWLRSDDAAPADPHDLAHRMPAEIAEIANAAGIT
jgi:hypothetical protein